ncbi:unnamed protein product [Rotaria sp. Silwood1]|nr:unnamed protein product [Rotaria sp. Silwood1]CAF1660744.1 unnamed protein product [Rotaria sp. Silwood1]
MIIKTMMEDLPIELWLDIFTYLNIQERFNGFFNLNQRINRILFNYHHHINLKDNDENSQFLFEHILPQLPHPQSISSLRLQNINKMNLFKNAKRLHFPYLKSLTLCCLYITNDILDLIYFHAHQLEHLNATLFISSKWNILLKLILSLPKLHTCYLYLGIGLCPIKSSISPIKHLTLLGSFQSCCMKNLDVLFSYLPYLHSLHIECDRLKFTKIIQNQYSNKLLSLSNFSLQINQLPELFIDLIDFITTTMPHIEKLKIKCCTPLKNLVYINVYQWMKAIDLLISLKELILIITLGTTIKQQVWNRRIEQLIKFTNMRHITLRIISSTEHKK